MNAAGASAGLGLCAAASWGGSDFVGGMGARKAPALLVVASGHILTFFLLLGYCLYIHQAVPDAHSLLFAMVGGFEGSIALAIFYRALAMGAMGLTAAFTGVLTALVPVVFSWVTDGLPKPYSAAGLAAGLLAIWLMTHAPDKLGPSTPRAALMLGALAGTLFGTQLILFKFASPGGVVATMTAGRAAGGLAMVLVLLLAPPKGPWKGFWGFGILAGLMDTAGTLFYLCATRLGRLDMAAVVCSLYPAGTTLLAAIVLRERPTPRQITGMALALGAVMLLSL